MWVSIVVVSIRVSFFAFGGSGKNMILLGYVVMMYFVFVESLIIFLEILPNFFTSLTVSVKMSYILCFFT